MSEGWARRKLQPDSCLRPVAGRSQWPAEGLQCSVAVKRVKGRLASRTAWHSFEMFALFARLQASDNKVEKGGPAQQLRILAASLECERPHGLLQPVAHCVPSFRDCVQFGKKTFGTCPSRPGCQCCDMRGYDGQVQLCFQSAILKTALKLSEQLYNSPKAIHIIVIQQWVNKHVTSNMSSVFLSSIKTHQNFSWYDIRPILKKKWRMVSCSSWAELNAVAAASSATSWQRLSAEFLMPYGTQKNDWRTRYDKCISFWWRLISRSLSKP